MERFSGVNLDLKTKTSSSKKSNFDDFYSLIKKKGFYDTYQILAQSKSFQTERNTFYKELNKFSYYNSFLRVKELLITKGLIKVEKIDGINTLSLSEKGIEVYNRLKALDSLIK